MRIALKITLAIVALVVALLAVEAWLRSDREAAVYEQDIRRDQRIVGRALERAVEITWARHGLDQAEELLSAAARHEREVDARIVQEEVALGHVPDDEPEAWDEAEVLQISEPTVLRTFIRLDGPTGERLALEVSTSLRGEEEYLQQGLRDFGLVALILLAVSAIVSSWFGRRFLGRRIDRLVEQAYKVGRGEFVRVDVRARDELGELGRALNDMSDALASAKVALDEETRARVAATEHLRRSERLATVGTLAAGLAHELGTPLHVIAGRARMIAEDGTTDEEHRGDARIVVEQAARVQRIIEQLLDFARPRHAERRPVDLAQILRGDINLLAPLLQRRSVRAELVALEGPTPPVVRADPDQLRQVFTNLLMNATQAMSRGGVIHVRLDHRQHPPEGLGDDPLGRYTRITITDEGSGIPPEHLPRLFDPFFTTKEIGEGTGLGLAVAYGIINDHGGWITATSQESGATFSVWLPEEEA
ncbi:MAG: ATP-binding protein [Nannocystaceae bacterium]